MSGCFLPPSPSWYCSKVSDNNEAGIFVYGARSSLHLLDTNVRPPRFVGDILHAHGDRVTGVALCKLAAYKHLCCSGGDDGKVKIWDLGSKACLHEHRLHDKNKITCIDWSVVEHDLVISGDDKGVIFCWNYTTGHQRKFTPESSYIYCLSASPHDSRYLAVGYKSGLILLIDTGQNGSLIHKLKGHDDEVHCVVWSPVLGEEIEKNWRKNESEADATDVGSTSVQGCLLASGSRDRTIRVWSSTRGRQVSLMKLPSSMGQRRDKGEDWGRTRVWLTLHWPKCWPMQIMSSSQSGEVLHWTPFSSQKQKWQPLNHKEAGGHNRIVFNICSGGVDMDTLCTISMDRQIIIWSLKELSSVQTIPTLGGFAYNITASAVDPSRIAIGVGDQMIRVWNTGNPGNPYDCMLLWQGIRGKVTALSWHPNKEGFLAYGTEDGRVGIYDILSNKPPLVSNTFHRKTVYVVAWGPAIQQSVDPPKVLSHAVYSVGDGLILQHDAHKMDAQALELNNEIARVNGNRKFPIRSEISWKSDFSVFAVGNDDGSVEVYHAVSCKLMCTVQVHRKLINCVRWHPQFVSSSSAPSPHRHWMACGSNDSVIHICDLGGVLDTEDAPSAIPVCITDSFCQLEGHSGRITGLSWSPHTDAMLVSASYDGTAKVWNVLKREPVASYSGHNGRLLTVLWSNLNSDVIFSGGDDFAVHQWKWPDWEGHDEKGGPQKRKKYKSKGKSYQGYRNRTPDVTDPQRETSSQSEVPVQTPATVQSQSANIDEVELLQKMLDEKRKLLEEQQQVQEQQEQQEHQKEHKSETDVKFTKENKAKFLSSIFGSSSEVTAGCHMATPTNLVNRAVVPSNDYKDRKKRKPKSLFPVSGATENRSKGAAQEDCVYLAKELWGRDGEEDQFDTSHLGLYMDRPQVYILLKSESDHHLSQGYIDGYLQLEVWKGNIRGALKYAAEHAALSDWLMSLAPMASKQTYLELCEVYAQQLEGEGNYHKAASYYLACHKVYQAIDMLKRNRLHREAVAMAKLRLSPSDPVLTSLQESWGRHLAKDGSYEQAAKCFLALKQPLEAAKLLARRADHSGLAAAAHVTISANEIEAGMLYAQRYVQECLAVCDWASAVTFSKSAEQFKVLAVFITTHEALVKFFVGQKCLDSDCLRKSFPSGLVSAELSVFAGKENDASLRWKSYVIEGEAFARHLSKIWKMNVFQETGEDSPDWGELYRHLLKWRAVKQGQLSILQFVIHVSMETALGILALLRGDLEVASEHFLDILSGAHGLGHIDTMIELCRLLFPQGKLSGEVGFIQPTSDAAVSPRMIIQSTVIKEKSLPENEPRETADMPWMFNTRSQECNTQDCLSAYISLCILYDMWWRNATISGSGAPKVKFEASNTDQHDIPSKEGANLDESKEEKLKSTSDGNVNESDHKCGDLLDDIHFDREAVETNKNYDTKAQLGTAVRDSANTVVLDRKYLQKLCQSLLWNTFAARNKLMCHLKDIETTLNVCPKKDIQLQGVAVEVDDGQKSDFVSCDSENCAWSENGTPKTLNVATDGNVVASSECVRSDTKDCDRGDALSSESNGSASLKDQSSSNTEDPIDDGSETYSTTVEESVGILLKEEEDLRQSLEQLPTLSKNLSFPDPVESAITISYMLKHQYDSLQKERLVIIGWAREFAATTQETTVLENLSL